MRPRRKASSRHKVELDIPELNLNSMMDLFAVLIPALLMMSAVVEVTLLSVAVPASQAGAPAPTPDKPPLELMVTILEDGYLLTGQGGVLVGPGAAAPRPVPQKAAPTIPLVQQSVSCGRFRNGWPPPRARNRKEAPCDDPAVQRTFWTYDTAALTQKVVALKQQYPSERRITLNAAPEVEYEALIDVMDATRDRREGSGEPQPLFDEVVLSPGVL